MKAQDLTFFNKEGYPHNLVWDEARAAWTGKILFDPNSSDTYKTVGLYAFERVAPVDVVAPISFKRFHHFNESGAEARSGRVASDVFSIEAVNYSPSFSTKWVNAPNIHNAIKLGDVLQFDGIPGAEFAHLLPDGRANLFVAIGHRKDAVLVQSSRPNSAFTTIANPDGSPAGSVKTVDAFVIDSSDAAYNAGLDYGSVNPGERFTVVGSRLNDGVYSTTSRIVEKERAVLRFGAADVPAPAYANLRLGLRVDLYNTLPLVYEGSLRVDAANKTIFFASPVKDAPGTYTPRRLNYNLRVGSVLALEGDPQFYTITEIARNRSWVKFEETVDDIPAYLTGDQPFVDDKRLLFTSNTLAFAVNAVPDGSSTMHGGYTLAQLVSQYKSTLAALGVLARWDDEKHELVVGTQFAEDYIDVTLNVYSDNGIDQLAETTNVPVYIIPVAQELSNEQLPTASSSYKRVFDFYNPEGADAIDSYGLRIGLNGRSYWVDQEDDDDSTLAQWVSSFGQQAAALGLPVARSGNTLTFQAEYPNVPAVMSLKLGEVSFYAVRHSTVQLREIQTATLGLVVNGKLYAAPAGNSPASSVLQWVNANKAALLAIGIVVSAVGDTIVFGTLDPERHLLYTVINKYTKLPGDTSVSVTSFRSEHAAGVVFSSCALVSAAVDFTSLGFSTGQVISILAPAVKTPQTRTPMYIQYTIIQASDAQLHLSYQGPFWNQPASNVSLHGAEFLREPRHAEQASGTNPRLTFDWGDTHSAEMFFYDFSGQQLKGLDAYRDWEVSSSTDTFEAWARKNRPALFAYSATDGVLYTGPRPLLGQDGAQSVRLNEEPNFDRDAAGSPLHQQSIFERLSFDLFYTDDENDITSEPEALQCFVGYRSLDEGVDRATVYVNLVEDRSLVVAPEFFGAVADNEVSFDPSGLVEILNGDPGMNSFMMAGFAPGQLVTVTGLDVTDHKKRAALANHGRTYRVLEVRAASLLLDVSELGMARESSVQMVSVSNAPYYDAQGQPRMERRGIQVTFTQAPTPVAQLLLSGQTEGEDPRYKLALENVGRDIKPKDLFIFKEYDIAESGIDWVILNRKRKEMLQVQSEIYNYVSSYKSVAAAIDYFGYSDLAFVEYFLNADQDSKDFGKLFSSELIDLLNRSVAGHTKQNANAARLPNEKYRKTNLFSLSYRITDDEGNFVDGYSFDEVTTKLFGLQRWLEDNVIPVGSRIADINGKAVAVSPKTVKHNTFAVKHVKCTDGFSPAVAVVQGYKSPIQTTAVVQNVAVSTTNTYNVTVKGVTQSGVWPDAVHVRITTFGMRSWSKYTTYSRGDVVYQDGAAWEYFYRIDTVGNVVTDVKYWKPVGTRAFVPVQVLEKTMYSQEDSVILTLNKESDPHFTVEVTSFNGYGGCWLDKRSYSLNYGVLA